jgi:predicted O-methyltransferase YrrM
MSNSEWSAVDAYFDGLFAPPDGVLAEAAAASKAAGLPPISVSASQGKLLHVLARAVRARHILEIGTLGGYSAIWLARALPPDGQLITLELDERHAEVAAQNLARAGLDAVAQVRQGPAADTLAELAGADAGPFDLVFIDADKGGYPGYLDWALKLSRPGTMIVADNVVRGGAVADAASSDPAVAGVREYLERLAADPRVEASACQTVGSKGYDGFSVAVVVG